MPGIAYRASEAIAMPALWESKSRVRNSCERSGFRVAYAARTKKAPAGALIVC